MVCGDKRKQLAGKAGRGSVLLGQRSNHAVLNKNIEQVPRQSGSPPAYRAAYGLLSHSNTLGGSLVPPLHHLRAGLWQREIPEGNGCSRGFQSLNVPFFFLFPPCFVVRGFLKELLCFVCAEASYTEKKVLICQYHKEELLIAELIFSLKHNSNGKESCKWCLNDSSEESSLLCIH